MQTKTCRRCSVNRVSTLCRLYDEGFRENHREARETLKALVKLSGDRGYAQGAELLVPDLPGEFIRRICWNVSSLLTEEDFIHSGIDGHGRGKTTR